MPISTLEDFQRIAKKRGGKCLSKTYSILRYKMMWKCSKGHIWEATGNSIKHQKSWCPKCCGRVHDISYMQKLAKQREGLCLSKKFIAVTKVLHWQCKNGHKWKAIPASIKQGSWCPHCSHYRHSSIDKLQKFAKKHGGTCVSKTYTGIRSSLKWQCKNKHIFITSIENLKRRKHFCLICKRKKLK
jgi:thiol-disulfide isomerase/thioredoxin